MKLALAVLLLAGPLVANATLVMLGDSFSDGGDRGNVPAAFGGILPGSVLVNERLSSGQANVGAYPAAPYYYGRATNGPVWIETAAGLLGQAVDNFAALGANSGSDTGRVLVKPPFGFVSDITRVPVPSLIQQAEAYAALKANGARGFQDSVIIFIGADEYHQKLLINALPPDPSQTIDNVRQALNVTYGAGVRKFVLVDLPSLSSFPLTAGSPTNALDTLVEDFNSELRDLAGSFNQTNDGSQVYVYDLSALFQEVLTDPSNAAWVGAFTNTTGSVLGGSDPEISQAAGFTNVVAASPESYIFWDSGHLSAHFHDVFGADFAYQLRPQISANLITLPLTTGRPGSGASS